MTLKKLIYFLALAFCPAVATAQLNQTVRTVRWITAIDTVTVTPQPTGTVGRIGDSLYMKTAGGFWRNISAGGGGGASVSATTIGAVPNANGLSIAANVVRLQPANGSFGGAMTTPAQSFAGVKRFLSFPNSNSSGTATGNEGYGLNSAVNAATNRQTVFGNGASTPQKGATAFGHLAVGELNDFAYGVNDAGGPPTLFGDSATGKGVSIGYHAYTGNREALALGQKSIAMELASMAAGDGAEAWNTNQVIIGDFIKGGVGANAVFAIGGGLLFNHSFISCIPCSGSSTRSWDMSTADHQGFLGGYQRTSSLYAFGAGFINDWWLGGPPAADSPHAITLNITDANFLTNQAGVDFTIKGGGGSGTGLPGTILFATSTSGSSGVTPHNKFNRLRIDGNIGDIVAMTGGMFAMAGNFNQNPANTLLTGFSNYGNSSTAGVGQFGYNLHIDNTGNPVRNNTSASGMALSMTNAFSENRIFGMFTTSGGTTTVPITFEGSGAVQLFAAGQYKWVSNATSARNTADTGIERFGAGVVRITNGSTGLGSMKTLVLAAGTATAATAPLKLTSGTVNTTPEIGAVEFDGTNYFGSLAGTRYTLAKTLTNTAALDFGSIAAGGNAVLTITVTGAADGDAVVRGIPNASMTAGLVFTAWVSAANTVSIQCVNTTAGAIDPASATFRASVIKY